MLDGIFGKFQFRAFQVRHTRPAWRRVLDAIGAVRRCEGETFLDTVHTAIRETKKTSRDAGSTMEDGLSQFREGYEKELPRSEVAKQSFDTAILAAFLRHFGGRLLRTLAIPAILLGGAIGVGLTLLWQTLFG